RGAGAFEWPFLDLDAGGNRGRGPLNQDGGRRRHESDRVSSAEAHMSNDISRMILAVTLLPFITVAPDHWSFTFRGGLAEARGGKHALHMTCESGTNEVAQRVKVAPGRALAAMAWMKGSQAEGRVLLRFRDAEGKEAGTADGAFAPAGGKWKKISVQGHA